MKKIFIILLECESVVHFSGKKCTDEERDDSQKRKPTTVNRETIRLTPEKNFIKKKNVTKNED
jgi:hypothetical protein